MSIEDKVRYPYLVHCYDHNAHKHYGLTSEEYCNEQINKMTNMEFLEAISKAVHEEII